MALQVHGISRSWAYLAAIVESPDDAIIAKDLDGVIQSWNTAAERIFVYIAAEAAGRTMAHVSGLAKWRNRLSSD